MEILICTDGTNASESAARLITLVNSSPDAGVTYLGVCEKEGDISLLEESFNRIDLSLKSRWPKRQLKIRYGHALEQILMELETNPYDFVVIGDPRPRGFHLIKMSTISVKLARRVSTHLLVGRNIPEKISKVLLCTGAESPSGLTLRVGAEFLSHINTEICLLHVMSQMALGLESMSDDLLDTAESAILRETREGIYLVNATKDLHLAGFTGHVVPKIRHGLVVEEVLDEIHTGVYDMLIIGAHYQPGQDRWLEILLDDITDQLLNKAPCSVLVV